MIDEIKKIIILGHSGFIGSYLMNFFQKHSHIVEIVGYSSPSLDLTDSHHVLELAGIFDLQTAVIMCSGIKKQFGDNLEIFSKNVKMVENICAILHDKPVCRFLYFSSAEVYGDAIHNTNISEDTPINPTTYYGIAKYTSERLLQKVIASQKDSSLLILRPPLVYGPCDTSRGYGPAGFVWSAINKEEIKLWGDGSELREFIFIYDLVKIVCNMTFNNYNGVLNVASGRSYTFQDILKILLDIVDFKFQINSCPRTKRKVDHIYSNKVLMQLLPDFVFTSLDEGVKYTLDAEFKKLNGIK
jgi:UDP-glucose 4-epimerase